MLRALAVILLAAALFAVFKFDLIDFNGGYSQIEWLGYRVQMPAVLLLLLPVLLFFIGFGFGQMYSWMQRLTWNKQGRRILSSHSLTGEVLLRQYVAEKLGKPLAKLKPKEQKVLQVPPAPQGVLYMLQRLENTDTNSATWEKWLDHSIVGPLAQLRLAARMAVRGDLEASQELLKPLTTKTKQRDPIEAAIQLYFLNLLSLKDWRGALEFLQKHKAQYVSHHYAAFAIAIAEQLDDTKVYARLVKELGAHPALIELYTPHLNHKEAGKLNSKADTYQAEHPDLTSKISGKIKAYKEAYVRSGEALLPH